MTVALSLLLVGLDAAAAQTLREQLTSERLSLTLAAGATQAEPLLLAHACAAVLLSLDLPPAEVSRVAKLAAASPRPALILLAGRGAVREPAARLGADAYLFPPLHPEDVLETMTSLGWGRGWRSAPLRS